MGFFDDLKELGRGIKDATKELGKDLGQIAKETKDEIKSDPGKFLLDSAKDVAGAVASVGKYAINHAVPDLTWQTMKKVEEQLQSGQLSDEQRADLMDRRRKAAMSEVRFLRHHTDRDLAEDITAKDVESRIDVVEAARRRLKWYLDLPDLGLELDDQAEAQEMVARSRETVDEWRAKQRELTDRSS